jgi:AcrR family transcriptional regulator
MSRATSKRSYDATSRRERAVDERRETRRKVLAAAHRLFVEKGYTATTVSAIANEAGVALQSVYKAGGSKAELLHHVIDIAVAGDDDDVLVQDRPGFAAMAAEPDAAAKLRILASIICDIQERRAPLNQANAEAAAVDAAAADNWRNAHRLRLETFGTAVRMVPEDRLRSSYEDAIDTAWAIGSTEVYRLMTDVRGLDQQQVRGWLAETLVAALLRTP